MNLWDSYLDQAKQEVNGTPITPPKEFTKDGFASPKTGPDAPTEKQINFFKTLVKGKDLLPEMKEKLKQELSNYTRKNVSDCISWLVTLPWTPVKLDIPIQPAPQPKAVDDGRYALSHNSGQMRFYEVKTPKQGKWSGFTFLSQLSGDNHIPIKDRTEKQTILNEIRKDAVNSLKLYGKLIGRCGHCRKTLTDEESRNFGIGPVCRRQLGL